MAEQNSPINRAVGAADTIALLNDQLRESITSPGHNRVVMIPGIAQLIGDTSLFRGFRRRAELLRAVRNFDAFDSGNDPCGEHDMGSLELDGTSCLWKIDYYDQALSGGSEDPADPSKTVRVLTIMRAGEG